MSGSASFESSTNLSDLAPDLLAPARADPPLAETRR
jgi:hypothetical protein